MERKNIKIAGIPAVLYGEEADGVYLAIHGKCGCKEEAESLAEIVCPTGWQVLAVDLPEHGERRGESGTFNPWSVVPELHGVMTYIRGRWKTVSLYACSIGAYFCLMSYAGELFEKCLFVSPLLDMRRLIEGMMAAASVTPERLKSEEEILCGNGETLSWRYYCYAADNPVSVWNSPTEILYAGGDFMTDRATVDAFASRFGCGLTVMENGEHWFHTDEQLDFLHRWINNNTGNEGK